MNFKSTISRTTILWSLVVLLVVAGIVALVYSFKGNQSDTPEDASTALYVVYTNAMSTVAAQQLTMQAGISTATMTPVTLISPTARFTPTPGGFPTLVPTSVFSAVGTSTCDASVYIADVTIPDGTAVTAGQTFTKTWKVSNTGTCAWNTTYQIILISGDAMSGKATQIGKTVKPGETAEVSVALTAPSTTGTVNGTWRLMNDKSQPFGTLLTVEIKVSAIAYPNP